MKTLLVTTALLTALATSAFADALTSGPITGNKWLQDCNSKDAVTQLACVSWTRGMVDGMGVAADITEQRFICGTGGVITRQFVEVGTKWMRQNPELRHKMAAPLLVIAFGEAWPCDESQLPDDKRTGVIPIPNAKRMPR